MGALYGADARAFALGRINGHGEVGFVLRAVVAHHQWQLQLSRTFIGDGHTDQTAGFTGKERDNFRCGRFRGDNQVTLVFAVFVIHQDDHFSGADIIEDIRDATQCHVLFSSVPRVSCIR